LKEIVKIDNKKLAVWSKYTKDGAYKNTTNNPAKNSDARMFSSIEQSYIWLKKS
jgi:hypothetical protein